jgi:uncharacterized protein
MTQYSPPADITSDDKLWALLAYILSPLVPIIIILMEDKKNRPFLKAHNIQALILGIIGVIIGSVLSFTCIVPLLYLILIIYYGVKAYKGEYVTIPVITNWVKSQGWA